MQQKIITDKLILIGIIITGAILRFYNFSSIPMTHDELSAFFRLNAGTFRELIEKGVKLDGHPAGVQVFLFCWTKIFGYSEGLFKLPFLLFGLGSVGLAYLVSKKWFNSTSALLVAAFIASLQFPVMYSQIARPYVSGLFFCLLMVLFWTQLIFETKNRNLINSIGFVLSAAVCTYNHHFSLLFTFIVCVTGLFYIKKGKSLPYLLSLLAIVILYIPHLDIFFFQLKSGGLNWLGKPRNSFVLDYVRYIFHFNTFVYLSVITIAVAGAYRNKARILPIHKFQIISIIWFITPALTGFFYSLFFTPVIQYSVLIFSFPYLLFFLFSFHGPASQSFKITFVMIVLLINISTLVWGRQHYDVFYKQAYKEYALLTRDFISRHDSKDVRIIFEEEPSYIDHYFSDFNPGLGYISTFKREISPVEFRKIIESENTDYLIAGGLKLQFLSIVKEYYPKLVFKEFGYTYEYYVFSRDPGIPEEAAIGDIVFTHKTGSQNFSEPDSGFEYGPAFEIALPDITDSRHNFLDIACEFKSAGEDPGGIIVCEILKNGESIEWHGSSLQDFSDSAKTEEWQKAYLSLRLADIFKRSGDMRECTVKVYYWNKEKKDIMLDHMLIQVREGNNKAYGLIEPFQ